MNNKIWKKAYQKRKNGVKRSFKSVCLCLLCVAMLASGMTIVPPAYAQETPCTQAAHTHEEKCYTQVTEEILEWLACTVDADEIVHQHNGLCFDDNGMLRCTLEEKKAHVHDESCVAPAHRHGDDCFREVPGLICPETTEHVHADVCYEQQQDLICGQEELSEVEGQLICAEEHEHTEDCWSAAHLGHKHTETCYKMVLGTLICTEHVHIDSCYEMVQEQICTEEEREESVLVCDKEELELHTHQEDCYDEEGTLICERAQVVEHIHSEACLVAETVSVDTEGLTCTVTDEDHEHGTLCYGTWVLTCDVPEHTHTELCGIVAAPNRTSETPDETTEATSETTEATETTESTEATEETTSEMEIAEGNESEYRDRLDGDHAFIDSLEIVDIVSGSAPFDPNDEPGNDSGPGNLVLRTFDTAIYKVKFSTALYNALLNKDIVGYKEGRVHFEFILPAAPEEAEFKLSSMGTLLELPGIVFSLDNSVIRTVTRNGEPQPQTIQVLRGSFLMPATDKAAIGSSELTLDVAVQVWRMSNGEILRPEFTLWLEYNNVGAEYTDESKTLHSNLVTGLNHTCETIDEENAEDKPEGADDELNRMHGVEARTVAAAPITVSAEPRFNVVVYRDAESVTSGLATYDFSTGGERAPHKTDLSHTQQNEKLDHSLYGRIYCYGVFVEMVADPENPAKGMMGAAFPDEDKPITFEVVVRSGYKANSSSGGYAMLENQYQALLWSAGANEFGVIDDSFERNAHLDFTSCYNTPLNHYNGNPRGNCYNGGNWHVELDSWTNAQGLVFDVAKITITDFEVNMNQMPSGFVSETRHVFWQPTDAIPDYLEMSRAIFASGELWAMVPYTSRVDAGAMLTEDYPSGSTRLQAIIRDVVIYHEDAKPGDVLGSNVNTGDDSVTYDAPFERAGDLDTLIRYSATDNFWNPLTTNCMNTLMDWALGSSDQTAPGQELAIAVQTNLHNAEGLNRGVGFDTLLKFDDAFFIPSSVATNGSWFDPNTDKILWVAKPSGTGWDHQGLNPDQPGYDAEMMQATPEQLIYFESLEELQRSHVCVGVLIQKRGSVFGIGNNQMITRVNGSVNPKAKPGYVYMTAFTNRVWRLFDVADAVREVNGLSAGAIPSDALFVNYAQTYLPKWQNQKASTGMSYHDYDTASYVESYQYTSSAVTNTNDGSQNGHRNSIKAVYDSNGRYVDGSGAYFYIDACLLLEYATSIGKSTAQLAPNPETSIIEAKRQYEQGLEQRYVDYVLTPQARRIVDGTGTTDNTIKTNVYIVDSIPEGMTLIPGSVYWEGQSGSISYESYPEFKGQGIITNGLQPVAAMGVPQPENKDGNGAWMELDTTAEGTLKITLHNVTVTGNNITDFGRIYYSCYIDSSVKGNTQLSNTASIQSDEDMREPKPENGNMVTFDITVLRMTALSFTKSADKLVAEWWEDLGFTMHLGNSSGTTLEDIILMDTLPLNTKDGTVFHGNLVVADMSAQLQTDGSAADPTADIRYYYTTNLNFAGCRASDFAIEDITNGGWTQLDVDSAAIVDGKIVFTQLAGVNPNGTQFYEGTDIPVQVIAIAAVGDIPAEHTLSMHVTLKLPHGQAGDVLYNYLSRSGNHTTYAKTTLINRKISGLVWYDINQDGIRQVNEDLWSGVWVTLMQEVAKGVYEPVYYQDTLGGEPEDRIPVVIKTGEQASMQRSGSVKAYQDAYGNEKVGAYLFTDLPAGTYAVCFNTGETYVLEQYQLTIKDKGDKTVNSNAEVYSNNGEFVGYLVPNIKLSATSLMNVSYEVSAYHDAGFCAPYLMPNTGGTGVVGYYILGAVLALPALTGLRRRKKR